MLTGVGVLLVGGLGFYVYTPQPATRSMAELRDAGIADGQPVVLECPERLTRQTIRRINANQPGALRPSQQYARVVRTARCFSVDGGNCVAPGTGVVRVGDLEASLVVPSLRRDLVGVDLDAGLVDATDGGDSDAVDDSLQYASTSCVLYGCGQYDDLVDAGLKPNPYATRFCGGLNRLAVSTPPCVIPNCWVGDGGAWVDNAVVDCRMVGPYGQWPDGGARWAGCNVGPAQYSTGTACVPVECSVVAGDSPPDFL